MDRKVFAEIKIGQKMGSVVGPQNFPTEEGCDRVGVVEEKAVNNWGHFLTIACTDGSVAKFVTSAKNPDTDYSIGWYLL